MFWSCNSNPACVDKQAVALFTTLYLKKYKEIFQRVNTDKGFHLSLETNGPDSISFQVPLI